MMNELTKQDNASASDPTYLLPGDMPVLEKCYWNLDDDDYNEYSTECGDMFRLDSGTPPENNMRYCPFCGGIIVPV